MLLVMRKSSGDSFWPMVNKTTSHQLSLKRGVVVLALEKAHDMELYIINKHLLKFSFFFFFTGVGWVILLVGRLQVRHHFPILIAPMKMIL